MVTVLFPGRHHLLTKFQHDYLLALIASGIQGKSVERIIFAVTSANHENTRRNPAPLYLRVLAIDAFARDLPCETKICPIPDVKSTEKFASYMLRQIEYLSGEKLTPKNTVLACSTPAVIKLFKRIGFRNLPVELVRQKPETYCTYRPWEVVEMVVKAGKSWRQDKRWRLYAHPASQEVYLRYNLGDPLVEVFNDSLVGEDADITETRDYNTYAQAMDTIAPLKFADIKPFVVEGKIVDAGCSTGSLIKLLAREFHESDIIGIEATRKLFEYCRMQEYATPYVFFYRRNIIDQNFKANSVNTFIYSSILHEIYSYLGKAALNRLLRNTFLQLAPHGRIIIRDVVGPEQPKRQVLMELNQRDGAQDGSIAKLSTFAKFFRFAQDFLPRRIRFKRVTIKGRSLIKLKLQDAYEYISKMSYVDNWQSEMHEEFGFFSFSKWKSVLQSIGFKIVDNSRPFRNPYIIENNYRGKVTLFTRNGKTLIEHPYPPTNMILAAEKP